MTDNDSGLAAGDGGRSLHKFLISYGQNIRAHHAGKMGDARNTQCVDTFVKARTQHSGNGDSQQQLGECGHYIQDSHNHLIGNTAKVTCNGTHGHADGCGDQHGENTNTERVAGTIEYPGKDIPA